MIRRPTGYALCAALLCLAGCSNASWSSGDRVIVAKHLYDTGLSNPQRFDVVVFKFPLRPVEGHQAKNYIKRLIGLPGEIIACFFGRLFRHQGEEFPFTDDEKRKHLEANRNLRDAAFEAGMFEIIRKPPNVMLSMRRIVYDNDFQPKDYPKQRWSPAADSAWKIENRTGLAISAGETVDWVRYQHLIRPKEGPITADDLLPHLITDSMGYNTHQTARIDLHGRWGGDVSVSSPTPNWAGDLMLECQVESKSSVGEFWMELSKGVDRFQVSFDLATGECKVHRVDLSGGRIEMGKAMTSVKGPGSRMIRIANIDARVTVWVNSELPFGHGVEYDPPELPKKGEKISADALAKRRGPTLNDLQPASLGAKGASVSLTSIRLWRDTYYSVWSAHGDWDRGDAKGVNWANPDSWAPLRNPKFWVEPGGDDADKSPHFLCLGDNSAASSDGREWGRVPERLLLGRALAVYYPFNRLQLIR